MHNDELLDIEASWKIAALRRSAADARLLGARVVDDLRARFGLPDSAFHIAGSLRRGVEEVGDVDLVVVCENAKFLAPKFAASTPQATFDSSYKGGGDIVRVRVEGFKVDCRFADPLVAGATLLWLTGSREFGRSLEELARAKGWTFTPDGVGLPSGEIPCDCSSERAVLAALTDGWWVDPVHRTGPFQDLVAHHVAVGP